MFDAALAPLPTEWVFAFMACHYVLRLSLVMRDLAVDALNPFSNPWGPQFQGLHRDILLRMS